MDLEQLRSAYREFFVKSEAGKDFMIKLQSFIDNNHSKAEYTPESARDYTQRAKGIREIKDVIYSIVTIKKDEQ